MHPQHACRVPHPKAHRSQHYQYLKDLIPGTAQVHSQDPLLPLLQGNLLR